MKLSKLRAQIRRLEAELKHMYEHARNLEISATMPHPLAHDHPSLTYDAKQRAMVLFWKHLTPEQRREFTRQRWFTAVGNLTGGKYRISRVRAVREEHSGEYCRFFCLVMCKEVTPLADVMLAKKIIIEKDERLFLTTAVDQGRHPAEYFDAVVAREYR